LIDIQDNGCGIPEEHLKQIWEPFFTTKGEKGTGLGLDICKRIIEEHHGTISCTSQVDVGTTFRISLPLNYDTSNVIRQT
jgi:signal transduction histidine kinase